MIALDLSKATLYRRMNELLKKNLIVREGNTSGIRYALNLDHKNGSSKKLNRVNQINDCNVAPKDSANGS